MNELNYSEVIVQIAEAIVQDKIDNELFNLIKLCLLSNPNENELKDNLASQKLERLQIDGTLDKYHLYMQNLEYEIPKGHKTQEYADKEIPKVNWLVDTLIPPGLIMIVAPPKAKKSFMMLDLCMNVSNGMDFFGHSTRKGTCLYFDLEVTFESTMRRIRRLCMGKHEDFDNLVIFNDEESEADKIKRIGMGFEEQFEMILKDNPNTVLAVIDMYQNIRPIRQTSENYQQDYIDLGKLKAITHKYKNLTLILVHHTRKSKDENDILNNVSGSTGLTGATDGLIVIDKKTRGSAEATISFTGKDIIEQDIQAHFDKTSMKWIAEGTVEEVELMNFLDGDVFKAVEQLCKENGRWTGTATELIESAWEDCQVSINLADELRDNSRQTSKYLKENMTLFREQGYIINTKPGRSNKTKYIISKL